MSERATTIRSNLTGTAATIREGLVTNTAGVAEGTRTLIEAVVNAVARKAWIVNAVTVNKKKIKYVYKTSMKHWMKNRQVDLKM